jgi:hypothetical protein
VNPDLRLNQAWIPKQLVATMALPRNETTDLHEVDVDDGVSGPLSPLFSSTSADQATQFEKQPQVVTTKVISGDEAFQQALMRERPSWIPPITLVLASFVAFCCSTANGYDGSLFGTLLANDTFKNFFAVNNVGVQAGMSAPL